MDDGREDKNPWTKWYWADWLAETGLRSSSLLARGLWMEMLSIMARSKRKGYLLDGEKQMDSKTLAKFANETPEVVDLLLDELRSHAVFSEDEVGIYNRRMAREGLISEARSEAGKLGGRPKKQNESKLKAKLKQGILKVESKTKAASASASAYASASNSSKGGVGGRLRFDGDAWIAITDSDMKVWSEAYPACDIQAELKKMKAWILANPAKGKKSNWRRFIQSWLSRTQDSGGTKGNQPIDDGREWAIRKTAEMRAKGELDD